MAAGEVASASTRIDQRIRELAGWRGEALARVRALIRAADPGITEEWKWGVPVWSHDGIVCTGEAYAKAVKLTFARGAKVPDPSRLFNSSLTGSTRRAIDIREGEAVDARAFKALVKAAVALNGASAKKSRASAAKSRAGAAKSRAGAAKSRPADGAATAGSGKAKPVRLLAGGNPQVAKADGDAPVQAYIAAMPGWKRAVGERLDALIVKSIPKVTKAVKWNSPFYGREGRGWFLAFHVFTNYVRVTFFKGGALRPPPAGLSKYPEVRYLDIREEPPLDERQFARWVKQAAALPGWVP